MMPPPEMDVAPSVEFISTIEKPEILHIDLEMLEFEVLRLLADNISAFRAVKHVRERTAWRVGICKDFVYDIRDRVNDGSYFEKEKPARKPKERDANDSGIGTVNTPLAAE